MVTFEQYPHFLYRKNPGTITRDADGNYTDGNSEVWEFVSRCREETNGKGTQINTSDGRVIVYSSLVQLPQSDAVFVPEGTFVFVAREQLSTAELQSLTDDGLKALALTRKIATRGECLKFDQGRLHSRLWL